MKKLIATAGVLCFALTVTAGEPSPSAPSVVELVQQLGSDDYREREAAVTALEKVGPRAIPALRAALKSDNPEVRHRAAPILAKLDRLALSNNLLAARKIALNYKDTPLLIAIDDLRKRTGLNIKFDEKRMSDPFQKVTCATDELPMWEALEVFCTAAGLKEEFCDELELQKTQKNNLTWNAYSGFVAPAIDAAPITLVEGKLSHVPGDRRTAVRVLALPRSFPGHRATLGTGETAFCFDIAPAAGLGWQVVTRVKITKLIDDSGRSGGAAASKSQFSMFDDPDGDIRMARRVQLGGFAAFGGQPVGFGGQAGGFGNFGCQFGNLGGQFGISGGVGFVGTLSTVPNPRIYSVPLQIATPAARSLKRLEGSVFGEVVLTNQTLLTITDLVKNVGVTKEGHRVRFTVVSMTEDDLGTNVKLQVEYPAPWAESAQCGRNPGGLWPEAPRRDQSFNVLSFDAAGKRIEPLIESSSVQTSADGIHMLCDMSWIFPKKIGGPAKFVVVGSRYQTVEVPFALENVPLP